MRNAWGNAHRELLQLSSQYLSTLKTQDDIIDVIKECNAKTVGEISGAVIGNEDIIKLLGAAKGQV